jgi:hypothetical protein
VVLLDEPETHLHARWQRLILPAVLRAAESLVSDGGGHVQVVSATHSPLVLASLEPSFDPGRDALIDLEVVPDAAGSPGVEARILPWKPEGDVSHWLVSDAIGLKSSTSKPAEDALLRARAVLQRREPPTPAERRDVEAALRKAGLSDIDPFWIDWRAGLNNSGVTQ